MKTGRILLYAWCSKAIRGMRRHGKDGYIIHILRRTLEDKAMLETYKWAEQCHIIIEAKGANGDSDRPNFFWVSIRSNIKYPVKHFKAWEP